MVIEIPLKNPYTQPIHGKTHLIGQKVRTSFIIWVFLIMLFNHHFNNIFDCFVKGFGVNTKLGIRQAFELGQYLRERYQTLLGDNKFSESHVYVQSET